MSEIQRLKTLLPTELQTRVVVVRSTDVNPALIATEKVGRDRYAIQLDLLRWEQLPEPQRDLLFWHEAARIQAGTVKTFPWELAVLGSGLTMSLIELVAQNLILFAVTLVVAGLAGNQLYQRNRGERSLREATAADQSAIALAMKFGYAFVEAYCALRDALIFLDRHAQKQTQKHKYEARLQVLAICARERQADGQKAPLNLDPIVPLRRYSAKVSGRAASELRVQ